jgi:hypothetical protein
MAECYCARIEDGVVTQVIVCGCAEWAARSLSRRPRSKTSKPSVHPQCTVGDSGISR